MNEGLGVTTPQDSRLQGVEDVDSEVPYQKITMKDLFMIKRYTFAAMTGSIGYFIQVFFEPILAIRISEFNLS